MGVAEQWAGATANKPVRVSNTAINMVSSLFPHNKIRADATLASIKGVVVDPTKVKRIAGLDNAFMARANGLDVTFRIEGDTVYITSVIKKR